MLKSYIALQTYLTGLLNRDDRGATAVEYGLLVALIAVVCIIAVTCLGKSASHKDNTVGSSIGS